MTTKRRLVITVERERTILMKQASDSSRAWCQVCGQRVETITLAEATFLAGVSASTVGEWLQAGKLHTDLYPGRTAAVCLRSLQGQIQEVST